MQRHTYIATRLAAAGILTAAASFLTTAPVSAATSEQDHTFVMQAAQGGMAEVMDGKLASTKASEPKVKSFASKMVADHTTNNMQLAEIAKSNGIALPTTLAASDAAMKAKLAAMSGSSFDSAYLTGQIAGHEKMEAVMKTEIASGSNPRLVAFAKATLPTVEQHLMMAKADK